MTCKYYILCQGTKFSTRNQVLEPKRFLTLVQAISYKHTIALYYSSNGSTLYGMIANDFNDINRLDGRSHNALMHRYRIRLFHTNDTAALHTVAYERPGFFQNTSHLHEICLIIDGSDLTST